MTVREQADTTAEAPARSSGRPAGAAGSGLVASADGVRRLQSAIGNRAVGRLLSRKYHGDTLVKSRAKARPPVAWVKTPPTVSAMSRLELFDAMHLIERWGRNADYGKSPHWATLYALLGELRERANQVCSQKQYWTYRVFTKTSPEQLKSFYSTAASQMLTSYEDWDYDLDVIQEVLLDRFPGDRRAAEAKQELNEALLDKGVDARKPFGKPRYLPSVINTATPANRGLAQAIDALDMLDAAALKKRHLELAWTVPGERGEGDQRELEAIEYVAHGRGLAPLRAEFLDASGKTSDRRNRFSWRFDVERRVRDRRSFKSAIRPVVDHPEVKEIQAEGERFAQVFRGRARDTAERMLRASRFAIGDVVKSYGLPSDSVKLAAERVYGGQNARDAAQDVITMALKTKEVDAETNYKRRANLARTVKELKALQDKHRPNVEWVGRVPRARQNPAKYPAVILPTDAEVEELKRAQAAMKESERPLAAAWAKAERDHAVLTGYRSRGGLLAGLGTLDAASADEQMKTLLVGLFSITTDIIKAQQMLARGGADFALTAPGVVALASKEMFIPPGSIRAGVVNDLVEEAKDKQSNPWITWATIALALITFVPSAGTSVGIAAGMASAALAASSTIGAYGRYNQQQTMSNTAIDRALALSQEEPALTDFIFEVVGLVAEIAPAFKIITSARKLRRLAVAGQDTTKAIAELDVLGKPYNRTDFSQQVLKTIDDPPPAPRIAGTRTAVQSGLNTRWTRTQIDELFRRVYGKYGVKGPPLNAIVVHATEAEYQAAVKAASATADPGYTSFFDEAAQKVHVSPTASPTDVMHEALHFVGSRSGTHKVVGSYVEEGLTEWLVRKQLGPQAGAHIYDGSHGFVELLAGTVGENAVRNAYLHGRWDGLRAALTRTAGSRDRVDEALHLLRQIGTDGKRHGVLDEVMELLGLPRAPTSIQRLPDGWRASWSWDARKSVTFKARGRGIVLTDINRGASRQESARQMLADSLRAAGRRRPASIRVEGISDQQVISDLARGLAPADTQLGKTIQDAAGNLQGTVTGWSRGIDDARRPWIEAQITYKGHPKPEPSNGPPPPKRQAVNSPPSKTVDPPPPKTSVQFGRLDDGYKLGKAPFMEHVKKPVPQEGWKLHVSADPTSAHAVADAVLPRLRQMNVNHKVVRSREELLTGIQEGKFITIYPDNLSDAQRIVAELDSALSRVSGPAPRVYEEQAVGSSGRVYARYGGFTKSTVTDPATGLEVKDVRGQISPPWVTNPWTK